MSNTIHDFVSIEHHQPLDEHTISALSNGLEDNVVVEYIPTPEMLWAKGDSNLTNANENFIFWDPLINKFLADGHVIKCLDPAHDKNFALIRVAPLLTTLSGTVASTIPLLQETQNLPPSTIITSLNLIGLAGISHGIAHTVGTIYEHIDGLSPIPIEATFRRSIVAHASKQLPTKHSFIYPPLHVKGIPSELDHPTLANIKFKCSSILKTVPILKESFFTGRTYKGFDGSGKPKLINTFPIE